MVLGEARARLSALKPLADALNDLSDSFSDELRTIEGELLNLNLGVEIVLPMPILKEEPEEIYEDPTDTPSRVEERHYHLAYAKLRKEWRIVVRTRKHTVDFSEDPTEPREYTSNEETKPLVDASRELRLAAADHILSLLDEMRTVAEQKVESLRQVTDTKKDKKK